MAAQNRQKARASTGRGSRLGKGFVRSIRHDIPLGIMPPAEELWRRRKKVQ